MNLRDTHHLGQTLAALGLPATEITQILQPSAHPVPQRPAHTRGEIHMHGTEPDLTELVPLAQVIADVVHSTPIRLGVPSPSLDLIQMLTVKVAAYIGREVLPPGSFDEARPPSTAWDVEARIDERGWSRWSGNFEDREAALESCAYSHELSPKQEFRVVRATTLYTIEPPLTAEEQPS